MITVFHGQNLALSRKNYIDIKQKASNPITLDGSSLTLALLTQALEGQGLFGDESQIFIEELLSKRKASKELEQLIWYIQEHSKENTIIVWESKDLTPKQIGLFGKPDVKKFDIPKEVFAFLDNLLPNNANKSIQLFHRVLQTEEPEFVFFMIVRQFRMMLGVLEEFSEQIDEIKRLTWQKSKIIKQASAFGKEALLDYYDNLFTIEHGMKTGQLGQSLEQEIDFFLSTI